LNFTKTIHDDIYPAIDPTKSDLAQPSKVVLITGAGRGIGRAVAIQYAKSGVTCIILCARTASELDDVKQEINKIDRQIRVRNIALSITDEAQVIAAAETVKKEEGRLDVLVNNAGVGGFPWVPIGDGIAESWWNTWNVHVNGTYLMLKAFLPLLVETAKKYDTIVDVLNTTSIGAQFTMPGASAYQTSKFAILRLSEFVMAEYGEQGVNCVALSPGAVKTKMSIGSPVEPSKSRFSFMGEFS